VRQKLKTVATVSMLQSLARCSDRDFGCDSSRAGSLLAQRDRIHFFGMDVCVRQKLKTVATVSMLQSLARCSDRDFGCDSSRAGSLLAQRDQTQFLE